MGGTAILIAVFYGIVVVISVGVVIAVAASTIRRGPMDERKAAHRERNWLLIVIALLVVLLFGTIFFIPYGKTAPKNSQVVDVTAYQFGWLLSRKTVKANVPVEFVLHSKDVAHDFGVYDSSGKYLFQVGIVPDYTQKLVHTFTTPGRYDVLCLEYCGLDHDSMQTSFQVVPVRNTARRLTLQYVVASTIILLVSGVFGVMMRDSQANVGRLGTNTWYALMTAHGLGAFLGWAGFAVMGFAFWILQEVGFELRRFGLFMARLTWWLMVVGVGGILVSTIVMHFAGSWVFLYPIPFHSAGQWGKWATAIFLSSVLLVGLSIVTWCLSIVDTVIGPGLHAVSTNIFNRLGVAMGFGYLWPKRFATNPEQVPYVVIPLTVIAIDMVIATLPLAVLLVEMIIETFAPSVHVSALLAKNVLWWFGHPVVYLLLFPAVAIYYYLVPKMANRKLVAGNVIAIAWVIAVIANVFVFAHHIYLDYPAGTAQATINTAMQPITFALTIPSALSLYSLFFTIYRSDWKWTGASTALFLGLVSWLTAGLSGVINATIAFDVVVHNTLWIVGHFHHMALLNIGFAIFGAIYYFLPGLTGKALYSDAMARWHIWLTFVFGLISFGLWLVQGLEGAPRRYAVLPHRYLSLSQAAIPFVIALALTQLLFVYNIVQTMRGAQKKPRSVATAEALFILAAVAAAIGIGVIGFFLGRDTAPKKSSGSATPTVTAPATTTATTTSAAEAGKALFVSSCGSCHTLKDAGTSGAVGPNLDDLEPDAARVAKQVTNGGKIMPSFKGSLTPAQITAVSAYVASVAGK